MCPQSVRNCLVAERQHQDLLIVNLTNTVEGFFALFKRGMRGTYQHCGEKHLQRYLNEFDFRYSYRKVDDPERPAAGRLYME